jgi:T4 RnlA family RNA ligase
MFPNHISHLDHLRDEKMIKFKDESVEFDGVIFKFTIVSYMIGDSDLWKKESAIECRGITFNEHGFAVSVPFEKFFNVGERESTLFHNLPKAESLIVMDKRDGSMITPVLLSSGWSKKIVFKTKKSFYSDVAKLANESTTKNVIELSQTLLEQSFTPIFEFTHPQAQIVIEYGNEPKLVLLAIRSNVDGSYWHQTSVESLAAKYGVECVPTFNLSVEDVHSKIETEENVEGWVIWFANYVDKMDWNGLRVKWKTKWYLARHHAKTQLRERDIADMVVDETIDDMKSFISSLGYSLNPIEVIEKEVVSQLNEIRNDVEVIVSQYKHLERKDFALKFNGYRYFGLLMNAYLNKEPDYVGYWKKVWRDEFSLNTVYSTFSGE